MKRTIAASVAAAIILSVGYYVFSALGSTTVTTPENTIVFDPKTELTEAVAEDGTVDFTDSAFKAQFKYYSSAFTDAKNSLTSSGYVIGGTGTGTPNNWSRYCAYSFSSDSDIISSKLVTSNGENRLVFSAPYTGEYTIVPYAIGEGGSLNLSVGGGLSAFGENSVEFSVFETRRNKTLFSATLNATTSTGNIASADGSNITVFLCEGDEVHFTVSTTASWHDVSHNSITLQSNFKITYSTEQSYSKSAEYVPAEYMRASVDGDSYTGTPYFENGVFRFDTAYYREYFLTMNQYTFGVTGQLTVGNAEEVYITENWYRYCAFSVPAFEGTLITSKMATGNKGSANRIVFVAPYTGYYEIVPRGLENAEESSVELNLGNYAEDFGTETASLKVINPQEETTYTDLTLYADDGNGNSNLTGEVENTKNIYLKKGEMLYFVTTTSASWFEQDSKQTVFIEFDFEIFLSQRDNIEASFRTVFLPKDTVINSNVLTLQTKYLGGSYKTVNEKREFDEYYLLGNNQGVNWDKYASFEIAKNKKSTVITRLVNKNSSAKAVFKAPMNGAYNLCGGKTLALSLGNYADEFSSTDSVKLEIRRTTSSGETVLGTFTLTKAAPSITLPTTLNGITLNKGDTISYTYTTTAEWFDKAEYQTISVSLDMKIEAYLTSDMFTVKAAYDPGDLLRTVTQHTPVTDTPLTDEAYIVDYSDCVFTPRNEYYSYDNATQYACHISGALYTYGYTYENGSDGRDNQLLRGSFMVGANYGTDIVAIMGKAGENCTQTLTFTAPEAGYYAINPEACSGTEPCWIKNLNKNDNTARGKITIFANDEEIYETRELSLGEEDFLIDSILVPLEKGEKIVFNFDAVDTTWNTDLRIRLKCSISQIEF